MNIIINNIMIIIIILIIYIMIAVDIKYPEGKN